MFTPTQFEAAKADISKAKTPEEAARMFGKLATVAMGQAVADALQKTLSEMSHNLAGTSGIQGWEKYITGLNVRCDWPSPQLLSTSVLAPMQCVPSAPANNAHLAGVSVSIGITGTF